MKTKLFLGALLTTSLLLSGCTISIKSDYQEGDGDNTPVVPVTPTWDDNTKALMENALHGYVLPYFDFIEVTFDVTSDSGIYYVEATSSTKINYSYVADFAATLNTLGFKMSDYYEDGTYFTGGMEFPEYNAYINVGVAALNDKGYVIEVSDDGEEGYFYVSVYNSYLYEWSTEIANYFAYKITDKEVNVLPPAIDAVYYSYDEESLCISAYLESSTDDAGYSAILTEAGWTVLEQKDSYGYYIAVAPDESYQVSYLYLDDYGSLDIYFESYTKKLAEWPADSALAYAKALSGSESPLLPPAFTAEGGYIVSDAYYAIFCYTASETDDAGYSAILAEAGWTVLEQKDSYGYYVAVAPDESYQVSYLYDTANARLRIYFETYTKPAVAWDEDAIKAVFTTYKATWIDIPTYDAENATFLVAEDPYNEVYYYYELFDYINVVVTINGTTADEFSTYLAKYEELGWSLITGTEDNEGRYAVTKDGYEIDFDARKEGTIVMTIYIFPATEESAE